MQTMEKYQKNPALVILDRQVGKIADEQLWAIFAHIQYAAARRVSAALGYLPFTWPLTPVDMQLNTQVASDVYALLAKAGIPAGRSQPDETRLAEYLRAINILLTEVYFVDEKHLQYALFCLKNYMRIGPRWLKQAAGIVEAEVEVEVTA
ncbi:MAG: hypothetical protein HPY85_10740 [Anaerolineae bacterium]|nr:hypothetical protein [Anaerolineae bacterium]